MQYNASQDIRTVRRYFIGTTVLRRGQILHYNELATKTDATPELRLGQAVEAVNTDNVKFFAGVVSDSDAGKTGPCFVEVLCPQSGDVLDAEADGTTDIAIGDFLEPDGTLGALIDGSEAAGDNLFVAMEAYTTDAAKLAVRVLKI